MTGADTERLLLGLRVNEFLVGEACLLDEWRLEEWLALFTDDATYVVPGTDDPDADAARSLVLIDDDRARLGWRVKRLLSGHAHREFPWSRTRRLVTNVRVERVSGDVLRAFASFVVWRFRHGHVDPFVGRLEYRLVEREGGLRIAAKRAMLDHESLAPNGALSLLL
ncbi:MAG: p-cumate 2,3-dioxygenase subunit beta [Candidatus Binatota bacterium]|nr:p-cumate 2,3-dioxygenase subunit beta [Candidatus Binatota bacterium]